MSTGWGVLWQVWPILDINLFRIHSVAQRGQRLLGVRDLRITTLINYTYVVTNLPSMPDRGDSWFCISKVKLFHGFCGFQWMQVAGLAREQRDG